MPNQSGPPSAVCRRSNPFSRFDGVPKDRAVPGQGRDASRLAAARPVSCFPIPGPRSPPLLVRWPASKEVGVSLVASLSYAATRLRGFGCLPRRCSDLCSCELVVRCPGGGTRARVWWPRWHTCGEGRSRRCETGPIVECTAARAVRRADDELLTKIRSPEKNQMVVGPIFGEVGGWGIGEVRVLRSAASENSARKWALLGFTE